MQTNFVSIKIFLYTCNHKPTEPARNAGIQMRTYTSKEKRDAILTGIAAYVIVALLAVIVLSSCSSARPCAAYGNHQWTKGKIEKRHTFKSF